MTHTIMFACRRVPDLTRAEYEQHYREIHAPLSRRLPGLVEYRQALLSEGEADGPVPTARYDSISTYVFVDDEAARAAWASPEGEAVNNDTPTFMDWQTIMSFQIQSERVLTPEEGRHA